MTESHNFHKTMLREYDIRGVLEQTLFAEDAHAIGRAFGSMVIRNGGKKVAVGRDGRHSSPLLEEALVKGLKACGLQVYRIGLGPSPMLYFATKHLETDAGVMITGSHNPPDYNGFKMLQSNGPVYGEEILQIGKVAAVGDYVSGAGQVETVDVSEAYIKRLLQDYQGGDELTIAWDAGNGAVGAVLQRLTDRLPGRHILLFDEVDGDFPNHHPDPTVDENMQDLRRVVLAEKCDFGIGFDGDGDRIGVLDEQGRMLFGDQLLAIYAREVLATHPGATVLGDVKCSQALFDEVKRLGGQPLMWKTGHSLLKAKMKETGSPLGGEISGHICFADKFYGFDDALYNGVRLMSQISQSGQSLGHMLDELPQSFHTPEARFQVDESRKFQIAGEIIDRLKGQDGMEIIDLDGVRVNTSEGWFLLRASNTQDVLSARVEAFSPDSLTKLKAMLCEQLSLSGVDAPAELR